MKVSYFLIFIISHSSFQAFSQWNANGNNQTTGQIEFLGTSGVSGIVASPNGWTKIDPNGGRFIFTVNNNDVSLSRNILDIDNVQSSWQHMMEPKADGSAFFRGNVGIGGGTPSTSKFEARSTNNKRTRINMNDESAISFIPNNGNSYFHISHGHDDKLHLSQGASVGSGKLVTFVNNGPVGIGTDSPTEKLDINGNIKLINSGNKIYWDWSSRTIEQYSPGVNSQMIRFRNSMDHSNPDGGFDFATHTGVSVLRINQEKVGIGTTDFPGNHKLRVEGSIGAREIKVEATGWSDFVFEKDYDLRTLAEVEKHITEHGHLPEIPSEAEVTENGINLGEMNAKLLQKIEELDALSHRTE